MSYASFPRSVGWVPEVESPEAGDPCEAHADCESANFQVASLFCCYGRCREGGDPECAGKCPPKSTYILETGKCRCDPGRFVVETPNDPEFKFRCVTPDDPNQKGVTEMPARPAPKIEEGSVVPALVIGGLVLGAIYYYMR